jgi:hypothetical protein
VPRLKLSILILRVRCSAGLNLMSHKTFGEWFCRQFTRVAASWTKQDLRHVLDDKPPLRFGDDAEGSLSNRRVIKKPRFLMRGDSQGYVHRLLVQRPANDRRINSHASDSAHSAQDSRLCGKG